MAKKIKETAEKAPDALRILWQEGFFKNEKSQDEVVINLSKRGNNFRVPTLSMALVRAKYLISNKKDGVLKYIQSKPAVSKETDQIRIELFEEGMIKKFGKAFEVELDDLRHNFGKSGNCTAFILRKILEKLIYLMFVKHGMEVKLKDKNIPGRLVGLEAMINIASNEKVDGIPFLTSHTAQEVKGIKFLGDASAHNPLVEVDMKMIVPQLPYIITAYKELLR
jgi:hypothetical protein